MYFPFSLRLSLGFTLLVGLFCWLFGTTVYQQAASNAENNLKDLLKNRATSVVVGKDLYTDEHSSPITLPSVDAFGSNGVSIQVYKLVNDEPYLIASTNTPVEPQQYVQTSVQSLGYSPYCWDKQAVTSVVIKRHLYYPDGLFTNTIYQGRNVLVYTILNPDTVHVIQTAHTTLDNERSLEQLRQTLMNGALMVLMLTLLGSWFISWSILTAVNRMSSTAQAISRSQNFSKRVRQKNGLIQDELSTLARTFNQMLARLEEAYRSQQRFVADASHELRAPITSICCNLDLLKRAPDLPATEVESAFEDVQAEATRMGRLVNDLLQLAHLDSVQEIAPQTALPSPQSAKTTRQVDLDSLVLEVFRQYRPLERREDHTGPRLLLETIAPASVQGDPDQLKQAIVALVDNALKYTASEGSVSLALKAAENVAQIVVSDTGIGIFPEDLPHIFERFYRADRARTRDKGGSGLGLSIAQSIAHEHQGSIEVSSTPGKGSIFILRLPLAK
jgi:signal transduction histidine kinase